MRVAVECVGRQGDFVQDFEDEFGALGFGHFGAVDGEAFAYDFADGESGGE